MNTATDVGARFQALSKDILDWQLRINPVGATAVGIHDYDAELGDLSREATEQKLADAKKFLASLRAIDPAALDAEDRIDWEILDIQLESGIKLEEILRGWRKNPGDYADLPVFGCYLLLTREFAPLDQRLEATLGRLKEVPKVVADGKANITEPVRVFVETALDTARGGVMFFQALIPAFAAQASSAALRAEVEKANAVAIDALEDWVRHVETLLPKARPEFGIGRELFDYLLKRKHLLDYDADSLHAKGLELFESTLAEMRETARRIDPSKTVGEVVEDLKQEHPEPGDLLAAYRQAMERSRQWVIDNGIVDLPAGERLVVEETPVFMRPVIPYAAYMPPAAFEEDQTGRFYVTPVDASATAEHQERQLRDHNSYGIPVTSVHEGYPGHHTQLVWANRNPRDIRKLNDSTLFSEGWAFYLEELAEQLGFVTGPEYRLIRLKDQLWRAGRIVLDAALHTRGMTVDEAVDFFVDKVHLERPNALAEVRRYTMSATQPMSYLIGKLELLKLVSDFKAKKGKDFDMRRFHNELLSQGNLPPGMMRRILLG